MSNQKNKKNLTITLIIIILIATIWLFVEKTKKDNTTENQTNQTADMFGSKKVDPKEVKTITGTVSNIAEKTMTIKTNQGDITVSISGVTPVIFANNSNQAKPAQMADVKLNNLVSVQYNLNTKTVNLITIK